MHQEFVSTESKTPREKWEAEEDRPSIRNMIPQALIVATWCSVLLGALGHAVSRCLALMPPWE